MNRVQDGFAASHLLCKERTMDGARGFLGLFNFGRFQRSKSGNWANYLLFLAIPQGLLGLILSLGLVFGCGHRVEVEPLPGPEAAPPIQSQPQHPAQSTPSAPRSKPSPSRIAPTPAPPGGVSLDDLDFIERHKPILTEEGLATWYTAAKGRQSANGQLFSDRSLTAAHRTLPMGSLIVVTNLSTNQSSPMRITDRGPFVEDRILDSTIASAKATGIYRMGRQGAARGVSHAQAHRHRRPLVCADRRLYQCAQGQ